MHLPVFGYTRGFCLDLVSGHQVKINQ